MNSSLPKYAGVAGSANASFGKTSVSKSTSSRTSPGVPHDAGIPNATLYASRCASAPSHALGVPAATAHAAMYPSKSPFACSAVANATTEPIENPQSSVRSGFPNRPLKCVVSALVS